MPREVPRLFDSPSRRFASELEYRNYLIHETDIPGLLEHNDLYVVIALLGFSSPERLLSILKRGGLEVTDDLGAVWRISRPAASSQGEGCEEFSASLGLDWENGLAVFYTDCRKTMEIDKFLMPTLLRGSSQMDLFVIYPSLMQRVLEALFAQHPEGRLVQFTARTSPGSAVDGTGREPCARAIHYWGVDGRAAYPELRDFYGTAISSAVVELSRPTTRIRMSHAGTLALCSGEPRVFFDLLEQHMIPEARRQRSIVYRTKRGQVPVGASRSPRSVPVAFPLTIHLNSPLRYYEVSRGLVQTLEDDDFQVLEHMEEEGSLFLHAELFDVQRVSRFRIWANEDHIRLLPGERTGLSTMLRFYEFVLTHVDPYAVLEA